MAFWVLDQWYDTLDYPALGFVAEPDDVLEADFAPDPRWSSVLEGPETVTRYGVVDADPSYTEPGDGHFLAWSDADNAYVPVAPNDLTSKTVEALREIFSDKSAQSEIEAGRLNDAVLSGRFGPPSVTFGTEDMRPSGTTLSDTLVGGFVPVWRLDKDTDEFLTTSRRKFHPSWAEVNVSVTGINVGANTGSVFIRVLMSSSADGEDVTTTTVGNFKSVAAAAENIQQTTTIMFNVPIDASKWHSFRILRDADDAGLDTLNNDWGVQALEVQPTAFVTFPPELPDEPEELTGRTFTAADSAALDIRVWHQIFPPANNTDLVSYKYYPITDAATLQDITTSTWLGNKWAFLWANRHNYDPAVWNKRPNYLWGTSFVEAYEVRATFSTLERAHMATCIQIRWLCGESRASLETLWESVGGSAADLVDEADAKDWIGTEDTIFVTHFPWDGSDYTVSLDKVVLAHGQFNEGANQDNNLGVVLDYEVGDSRSVADTTAFIEEYADILHDNDRELFVYTNPLTNIVQQYHGIDSTNLPDILAATDYIGVMLTSNLALEGTVPSAYAAAMTALGSPSGAEWEKIVIVFELGVAPGTTLEDAEWVYDKLHEEGDEHPDKLMFWRYWAQLGGGPERLTNKKISMACFGTITPPSMGGGS